MLNELNARLEAVKTFYNGYKWMEDFGQRMSDASNKEEMLTYRQKLLDLKQELGTQRFYDKHINNTESNFKCPEIRGSFGNQRF